jgi:serine/threonine protein kinase
VVNCLASTVACDVFSAGVFVALLLQELAPKTFASVRRVLGEEDLSWTDIDRLERGFAQDKTLPAAAKQLLVACLDPSATNRPSAYDLKHHRFLKGVRTKSTRTPPPPPSDPLHALHQMAGL